MVTRGLCSNVFLFIKAGKDRFLGGLAKSTRLNDELVEYYRARLVEEQKKEPGPDPRLFKLKHYGIFYYGELR